MTDEIPDWERRFRAPRVGLPDWARDRPDRAAVVATANGVLEVHSWDHSRNVLVQATRRKEGTAHATIDPGGEWLWWFDDGDGDEFGVWRRQPFGSGPDADVEDPTGLPAAYPSGLAIGRDGLVVVGRADDDYGAQIHVVTPGAPARLLYEHSEDAGVGDLSEDGELVAISHSEHGDSRHPALRVVRALDGTTVARALGRAREGPGSLRLRPGRRRHPAAGGPRAAGPARAADLGRGERRAAGARARRPRRDLGRRLVPRRDRPARRRRPRRAHAPVPLRPRRRLPRDAGRARRGQRARRHDTPGRRRMDELVERRAAAVGAGPGGGRRPGAARRPGAGVRAGRGRLGRGSRRPRSTLCCAGPPAPRGPRCR